MVLRIFNTLSRQKEVFTPLTENLVRMYCCGPTVYNYAHIGNLRCYLFEDFLRRTLDYNGFKITHVMNVTDVGHLTGDSDEGEDKMEKGATREGKSVTEIAQFYTDAFFNDTKQLNIVKPNIVCKATEHIPEMISMIKKLEEKNLTYIADGNVYYDVSKFVYYRELGKLTFDAMKSTERVKDDTEKKNPQDFVLWFTQSKFKNHTMQWDSPWGRGYPGWHIECSAMSTKYLGEQFDIHCGGIDHIQVHHTNEIAQTEGATGKHPWVKYWMHSEFLVMNNGKMAKSDGSFITLQILKDKGYDPLVYRYFCMGTHYRQMLNFSYIALDNAKNAYDGLINRIIALKNDVRQAKNVKDVANVNNLLSTKSELMLQFEGRFLNAINDDLNIPLAVGIMHEVLRSNISITEKLALMLDFDKVFGLNFKDVESKSFVSKDETAVLKDLLDKRTEARKNKDWAGADKIRDEITAKGYVIKDTPAGPVLEKAN